MWARTRRRESAGGPGEPAITSIRSHPIDLANAGLPSPTPGVRLGDVGTGGAQEPNASGAPWLLLGAEHALAAGTSDRYIGVAPFGRTYGTGSGCQAALPLVVSKISCCWSVPSGFIV